VLRIPLSDAGDGARNLGERCHGSAKVNEKQISKLWLLGPPLSLALLFLACYAKLPFARKLIDEKLPWVGQTAVAQRAIAILHAPPSLPFEQAPSSDTAPQAPPDSEAAPGARAPLEFGDIAADRSTWPKAVRLKKPTEFPAVSNGKVVGKLRSPAGAEVTLVAIQQGKLGVQFQGGGAWVAPEETDIVDRVRAAAP
jgi:hypothetical protein